MKSYFLECTPKSFFLSCYLIRKWSLERHEQLEIYFCVFCETMAMETVSPQDASLPNLCLTS